MLFCFVDESDSWNFYGRNETELEIFLCRVRLTMRNANTCINSNIKVCHSIIGYTSYSFPTRNAKVNIRQNEFTIQGEFRTIFEASKIQCLVKPGVNHCPTGALILLN